MLSVQPIRGVGTLSDMELTYTVPGMTCGHCTAAVEAEIGQVPGVETVTADLETKQVSVTGESLDDTLLRAAIGDAGYEAVA